MRTRPRHGVGKTLFGHFLETLRNTPDGDGNLLNHSMIVFERLFGDGGSAADRRAQARHAGSILESVTQER